ncbi:hypothetical protein MTO96_015658 [Rhipicephalus appendiculatus]
MQFAATIDWALKSHTIHFYSQRSEKQSSWVRFVLHGNDKTKTPSTTVKTGNNARKHTKNLEDKKLFTWDPADKKEHEANDNARIVVDQSETNMASCTLHYALCRTWRTNADASPAPLAAETGKSAVLGD